MSARFLCLWFAAALAAAFTSRAELRSASAGRCAFDGDALTATARVEVLEDPLPIATFCSADCALAWAASKPPSAPRRFQVHDERDGAPLDPDAAVFVRSALPSASGRSALRAFRDPVLAAEYAHAFGGALVPSPFPPRPR